MKERRAGRRAPWVRPEFGPASAQAGFCQVADGEFLLHVSVTQLETGVSDVCG